jgi:hypothetical protein
MTEDARSRDRDGYQRRRADKALDDRLDRVDDEIDRLRADVAHLSVRVAVIGGVLSVVTVIANIIGPIIAIKVLTPGP